MAIAHTPDPAKIFLPSSLKDGNVETMANAVCCRCYTGDTSTYNGDLGPAEGFASVWRSWGQDLVCKVLKNLEPK